MAIYHGQHGIVRMPECEKKKMRRCHVLSTCIYVPVHCVRRSNKSCSFFFFFLSAGHCDLALPPFSPLLFYLRPLYYSHVCSTPDFGAR